ncbi:MAG: hypothetical protein AAGB51_12365 [Planctomycetota bacterium]
MPAPVKDMLGNVVPDVGELREAFRCATPDIEAINETIASFHREVTRVASRPGGQKIDRKHVHSLVWNLRHHLMLDARPYAVCPVCSGDPAGECAACGGRGWLSARQYQQYLRDVAG